MKIDFKQVLEFWNNVDENSIQDADISDNRLKRDFLLMGTVSSKMLVNTGILGGQRECDTMIDILGRPTRKNLAWTVLEVMVRKGIKIENRDDLLILAEMIRMRANHKTIKNFLKQAEPFLKKTDYWVLPNIYVKNEEEIIDYYTEVAPGLEKPLDTIAKHMIDKMEESEMDFTTNYPISEAGKLAYDDDFIAIRMLRSKAITFEEIFKNEEILSYINRKGESLAYRLTEYEKIAGKPIEEVVKYIRNKNVLLMGSVGGRTVFYNIRRYIEYIDEDILPYYFKEV